MNKRCFFFNSKKRVSLLAAFGSLVIAKMSNESDELRSRFSTICQKAYNLPHALKMSNVLQSDLKELRKKLKSKSNLIPKTLDDRQVRIKVLFV